MMVCLLVCFFIKPDKIAILKKKYNDGLIIITECTQCMQVMRE